MIRSAMTSPVVTFIAATMEMVPWRTYSNSRRAPRPGRAGICGCLRDFAWMPVFSSTLISTVPGGGFRYRRQTCPALAQNAGSSARLSQPRTLCGRTLASPSTRPTVAAEIARPARPGGWRSRAATTVIRPLAGPRWRRRGPPASRWGRGSLAARSGAYRTGPVSRAPRTGAARSARPPRCSPGPGRWPRSPSRPRRPARSWPAAPAAAVDPARTICSSFRRRFFVSVLLTGWARPAIGISFRVTVNTEECRHTWAERADIRTRRRVAHPGPAPSPAQAGH